ncbi:Cell division cycle-associated 7-like protein [Microtus ochrogaster]|uniref:Cell division cycle-associated 7-like protein n=1 Tax=Microtus ochrogaster TaxID=79684 RepID=A0A8J6KXC1_MICOH|nr:Cell division cycle-associated 7-like protein [Microtus ochrogaster]
MQAARTLRALPRRPRGRDRSALLHGKLPARCVLGAAPARVAACRAQAEPGREDGAGYALPGPTLCGCYVDFRKYCLRFFGAQILVAQPPERSGKIPKEVADIFNAPSDDEDFVGFQDDVPMENLSESCDCLDSLELEKQQDVCFHSKYLTEELRKIFIEDTDSDAEEFEGFTESELNVSSDPELVQSELSDSGKTTVESEEEEEEEEEEEAVPRRGRSTRSSFGLRVAFQFPTKKLAKTPNKSSSHLVDSKTDLRREKSCRQAKEREDSASESDDDSRTESQNSDALLKRAMNIKENKAMLAQLLAELNSVPDFFPVRTPSSASKRRTARRAFSEGQVIRRMNPARSARPPEKFALENFTFSAAKLSEELSSFRRRTVSGVFTV